MPRSRQLSSLEGREYLACTRLAGDHELYDQQAGYVVDAVVIIYSAPSVGLKSPLLCLPSVTAVPNAQNPTY